MSAYLIQVTLCLGVFYGFYHFVLQRDTLFQFSRVYLLVTLLFSLFLPFLRIYIDSPSGKPEEMILPYHYVGYYVDAFSTGIEIKPETKSFPWGKVLAVLYGLGVLAMVFRFAKAIREIIRIRNTGTPMAISGHPCIFSEKVKSPFSFFNTVFLPHDHCFTPIELQEILAHENVHIQGRHTWDILLLEVACIFLWPSPLIYLYRKSLKEVHEYMADAEVVRHTPWEQYAKLLLSQHQSHLLNQLTHQFFYSQLKKRLRMMNQKQSGTFAGLKYLGLIPLVLIALVFFSLRAQSGSAESQVMMMEKAHSRDPIQLYIEADRTYFLNGRAVPLAKLEEILRDLISEVQNPSIQLKMNKSLTVQDLANVLTIGEKLHIRMVLDSTEEMKQPAGSLQGGLDLYGDTLPPHESSGKELENRAASISEMSGSNQAVTEADPFIYAEEMPRFPGCEHVLDPNERTACAASKMFQFINENIKYPTVDKENNIEGLGLVQFVIETDGQLSNFNVVRSPSQTIKEELLRLMGLMRDMPEKWAPARNEGNPVRLIFTLPVRFKLDSKAQPSSEIRSSPGLQEKIDHEIKVTPNPANGTISFDIFQDVNIVKVFDTAGKEFISYNVQSVNAKNITLDISRLNSGQYILQMISKSHFASTSFVVFR